MMDNTREINKINIWYDFTLNFPEENDKNNNNPIFKLISNFNEIKNLEQKKKDFLKVLYFNRFKIHQILYKEDETLTINDDEINNNEFHSFFYLALLIEEDINLVNYKYSYKLIKKINEMQDQENNLIIKKILMAKIILILISNYEHSEFEEVEYDEDINRILANYKTSNKKIIKDNKNILNKFNLEVDKVLWELKLEEVYSEILKCLVIENKWNQSEYMENIINDIDLKNINLTKVMFDKLCEVLKSGKTYLKDYSFSEYEDIFNENKISFYHYLFKYILKCDIYIFQIPFLFKTRNIIMKILNNNIEEFRKTMKEKKNDSNLINVLKVFIEYDYYLDKSLIIIQKKNQNNSASASSNNIVDGNSLRSYNDYNLNSNSGMPSSGYFSGVSFNQVKNMKSGRSVDVYEDERPNNEETFSSFKYKNQKEKAFKILQHSVFEINVSRKNDIVSINYNSINIIKDGNENKKTKKKKQYNIDEIKNISSQNSILNDNYKKFLEVLNTIENRISTDFKKNDRDYNITLIFTLKDFSKINTIRLSCKYVLKTPNDEVLDYEDANILVDGLKDGIGYLLEEMNSDE